MRSRRLLLFLVLCTPIGAKDVPPDIERALGALKIEDPATVPEALELLVETNDRKLLAAVAEFGARTRRPKHAILTGKALLALGDKAAAKLIAKQLKVNKKVPWRLVRVGMMAEQIPGAPGREILEALAKDRRPLVAANALRGIGARREEKSRPLMLKLLGSKRGGVAIAAAFALAHLKSDQPTMEALFKRVQRANKERVGDSCALALSRMSGAESFGNRALALLIKRSTHDSFHALVKCALRLASRPDRKLLDLALKAPSPRVREVAYDMIGLRKVKNYGPALLRGATSEHGWRNVVAAWLALRRSGVEDVLDGVVSAIGRGDEPSYWAIQCVIKDPPDAVVPALKSASLDTKDPVRRELAQRALNNVKTRRQEIRDFYLTEYAKNRAAPRSRVALIGLGNLKDPTSFQALVTLLERAKGNRGLELDVLRGLEKLTGHYYDPKPEIWREWFKVVGGKVSFDPKPVDRTANRRRVKDVKELGVSPKTEAAVEAGLLWLARHQDKDGGWNGSTYHDNCTYEEDCASSGGIRNRPLAYTGLALLAYQGAGYTHQYGPYRDVVQSGFEYMMSHQDYDGSHEEKGWTFSYEAAIMCQALCDGYALTGDPFLGDGAQRVLDYLVKIQYPGRTWRYRVRSDGTDTSVMSWILTACISARHAGLDMPEQIFVASEAWLDKACDPVPPGEFELFVPDQFKKDNRYFIDVSRDRRGKLRHFKIKTWYQPPRLYTPAMSAIGLLCRVWLGWTRAHPFCIGAANQMASHTPGYTTGLEREIGFYPYTWYYGSLAMYQMGGRYWTRWRDKCIKDVLRNQQRSGCEHGSWKMPKAQFVSGLTGGTIYSTCMAILTLETFYRYQPYLSRFELRGSTEVEEPEKGKDDKKEKAKDPKKAKEDAKK